MSIDEGNCRESVALGIKHCPCGIDRGAVGVSNIEIPQRHANEKFVFGHVIAGWNGSIFGTAGNRL